MSILVLNGPDLYHAFISGAQRIINEKQKLNKINVFPVPDGDTGSNMSYMMQQIINEAQPAESIAQTMESIANAAIVGSRGNSGIIFAEYLNGLFEVLKDKVSAKLEDFHQAVKNGINKAYQAILNPVEGTILTVLRKSFDVDIADGDFRNYFRTILRKAKIALEETTNELEVLKRNKVVDAGALGLTAFLEGINHYLETGEAVIYTAANDEDTEEFFHEMNVTERYCTEALLHNVTCTSQELRSRLQDYGDSLIVSGRQEKMRLHIHTNQPELVFMKLRQYGQIVDQKVDDMIRQQQALEEGHPRIAVVTDSIADIPLEINDRYHIHVVPINLMIDGVSYLDKVTVTTETFYQMLNQSKSFSSSQPDKKTIETQMSFFEKHYDQVIVLTVASKLSGTYNAWVQATKNNPKFMIVDTKQNSGAQGLVVYEVAKLIHEGKSFAEVQALIPDIIEKTRIYVSVKTLKYMVRQGRVSKVTGIAAKIMNLKPVISLGKEGEGIIKCKAFSLKGNVKQILRLMQASEVEHYIIVHALAEPRAKKLSEKIEKITHKKPLYMTAISPVVAMNAGIGAVAVAAKFKGQVD